MKIFVDSANPETIESLVPLRIIDGVTTNPSLLAREPGDPSETLARICRAVGGPVSAEGRGDRCGGDGRRGAPARRHR